MITQERPFCIFVRLLTGKTITIMASPTLLVSQLSDRISEKCGIPSSALYLVIGGKPLCNHEGLWAYGISRDSLVHMYGRVLGGAPSFPGQWTCGHCNMSGCWPTKTSCFRCGAPRMGGGQGGMGRRPQPPSKPWAGRHLLRLWATQRSGNPGPKLPKLSNLEGQPIQAGLTPTWSFVCLR